MGQEASDLTIGFTVLGTVLVLVLVFYLISGIVAIMERDRWNPTVITVLNVVRSCLLLGPLGPLLLWLKRKQEQGLRQDEKEKPDISRRSSGSMASESTKAPDGLAEQLTRLGKLHTDGALSDAEFSTLKAKFISQTGDSETHELGTGAVEDELFQENEILKHNKRQARNFKTKSSSSSTNMNKLDHKKLLDHVVWYTPFLILAIVGGIVGTPWSRDHLRSYYSSSDATEAPAVQQSSESPISCSLDQSVLPDANSITYNFISCDVTATKAVITNVVLNRGRCESPVLTNEERQAIWNNLTEKDRADMTQTLTINRSFMIQFYARALAMGQMLSALQQVSPNANKTQTANQNKLFARLRLLNDPTKRPSDGRQIDYGYGDKIQFLIVCNNLLEYSIDTNGQTWTWKTP